MPLFYYVNVPVLEMRREPIERSEVVSQALFSEQVQKIAEHDGWMRIATVADGYQGWVRATGIIERHSPLFQGADTLFVDRLSAHIYDVEDTVLGPILTLPFESRLSLAGQDDSRSRWLKVSLPDSRLGFIQRGDVRRGQQVLTRHEACSISHRFLGLPYTWGGRSSFGYDCSGFVQMIYRQMGILLPRDSAEQFVWNRLQPSDIQSLDKGDLLFFGFAPDRIAHVGLALGEGAFIHTCAVVENAPYVRISSLKDAAWDGSGYYPFIAGRKLVLDS